MTIYEIPLPYEILVAATFECILGFSPGMVEYTFEEKTGVGIFHLEQMKLGDITDLEFRKTGEKITEITVRPPKYVTFAEAENYLKHEKPFEYDKLRENNKGRYDKLKQISKELREERIAHLNSIIKGYFNRLLQEKIWENAGVKPPEFIFGVGGAPIPKSDVSLNPGNDYFFEEFTINGIPSVFTNMIKRYSGRARDIGVNFTVKENMLERDANPIKICWTYFDLETSQDRAGIGWIDGHEIPGGRTRLSFVYDKQYAYLEMGRDWLIDKLLENEFIIVAKESVIAVHQKNEMVSEGDNLHSHIKKNKRGQSSFTEEEKLQALKDWDNVESGYMTLDEFLDNRFGNQGGILVVAKPTFHSWRRKLREKGLYNPKE